MTGHRVAPDRANGRFGGVIFDLGGVILESPISAITGFESELGLERGTLNRLVFSAGDDGAWARHERGELPRADFLRELAGEFAAAGIEVDTGELMRRVDQSIEPRPEMLRAVRRLRRAGFRVAALTNNWTPFGDDPLVDEFDVFVESVVGGMRKPEPRVYRHVLDLLGTGAEETVMLDDLGPNLKPARELGITTIKVTSPDMALVELGRLLGIDLHGV